MSRWRRWVFEIQAPTDEFLSHMQRALTLRGVDIEDAEHHDFTARAFGVRAHITTRWIDTGIEVRVKLKSALFSSPRALEQLLLEAGREAQTKLTYEKGP